MKAKHKKLHEDLRQMGCCVSLFVFGYEGTPADLHHLVEGSKRLGDEFVIPLAPRFHRQGTADYPSIHSVNGKHGGKKLFKATYGYDEWELLEKCEDWLGRRYSEAA